MSYKFNIGDKVRLDPNKYTSYSTIHRHRSYYVVSLVDGKIGLSTERWGQAQNLYSQHNFELVEAVTATENTKSNGNQETDVLVFHEKGNMVTRCQLDAVHEVLRGLLKKNPDQTYIVYAPQFKASLPELPIQVTQITIQPPIQEAEPAPQVEPEDASTAVS